MVFEGLHICDNIPEDAEIHQDFLQDDTWWYNKRPRDPKGKTMVLGGTRVYYCAWCGVKLETLK